MLGSGGGERGELTRGSGVRGAGPVQESGSVVRSVLACFLLICIVVVPVPFVCCSVKLPLSQPTSFCLFLSILLRTAAGGGAAAWRFCCRRQPKPKQLQSTYESAVIFRLQPNCYCLEDEPFCLNTGGSFCFATLSLSVANTL